MQITIEGTKFLHINGNDSTLMVVQGIRQKNPKSVPGYRQDDKKLHVYRKVTDDGSSKDGSEPVMVTPEPEKESTGRVYPSESENGNDSKTEEVLSDSEVSDLGVAEPSTEEHNNTI